MMKFLGLLALAPFFASPCSAAATPDVYGKLTMKDLAHVLNDIRGVPAEVKTNSSGADVVIVDAQVYKASGHIQLNGIGCDPTTPPACTVFGLGKVIQVPTGSVSDEQLLGVQKKFDFVVMRNTSPTAIVVSMPLVIAGGVTAELVDNTLSFFSDQVKSVTEELIKQDPAAALPPPKAAPAKPDKKS